MTHAGHKAYKKVDQRVRDPVPNPLFLCFFVSLFQGKNEKSPKKRSLSIEY